MTAIGNSRGTLVAGAVVIALACCPPVTWLHADATALKLRATVIGAAGADSALTLELSRWSTDAERAPLVGALSAPSPAPPPAAGAAGGRAAAADAASARGGRAARGGRGTAPPSSPLARLTAAIKAAPTIGYIWSAGITGYSIKYAWRAATPDGGDRVVLVTDRRLGANATSWLPVSGGPADAEFTVLEMRLDGSGVGEAKASLTTAVAVDAAAKTLALDDYGSAPALLKVTR